jgi:hypothetical protein
MEALRDQFVRETDPAEQKTIAEAVQERAAEIVTHIPLGQWYQPSLMRKNLVGMIKAPRPCSGTWSSSSLERPKHTQAPVALLKHGCRRIWPKGSVWVWSGSCTVLAVASAERQLTLPIPDCQVRKSDSWPNPSLLFVGSPVS